jgi:hypothetical protein
VYDRLKEQNANVKVVENSDIPERKFFNEDTIDLGDENIELGGVFDYIIENYSDLENTFIGIWNNDLLDIPDNYMECLKPYFRDDVGCVSSSLNDAGCPYPGHSTNPEIDFHELDVIEGVCPFYNSLLLREFRKYTPINKAAFLDYYICKKGTQMGLKNIIVHTTFLTHIRSGVRKELEEINQNFTRWKNFIVPEYNEWLERFPELKGM